MSPPRHSPATYIAVALGSLIGGVSRAGISLATELCCNSPFPWATLLVNLLGSLLIGLYASATRSGGRLVASTAQRHFVMAGFCGGFTTFSAFSLESLQLMQGGKAGLAAIYVGISIAGWLAAVWLGDHFGRRHAAR